MTEAPLHDVLIIGGSYAGLAAAMTLGRSRRRVLVIDAGEPCNRQTPHAHNLPAHDGDVPAALAAKARAQVAAYLTVVFAADRVTGLGGSTGAFEARTAGGAVHRGKKLVLATGVYDEPLPIDGFAACWGITVLHCPYCHGYEVADAPLGVIANGEMALEFARLIHHWSKDLTVFTNGPATLPAASRQQLEDRGIRIVEQRVARMEHTAGVLHHLILEDGATHPLRAVFARGGIRQHTDIAQQIGCALHTEGMLAGLVQVDEFGKTTVPGVYAAGDTATPMRMLSAAMAAGAKAGAVLNHELIAEEF